MRRSIVSPLSTPLLMLRNAGQCYRMVGVLGGSIAMTEWLKQR